MLTIADRITLLRLVIAPVIVACYLLLPAEPVWAFWFCGWLVGAAELTDYLDGIIARARREVSDFGKLADPFCDVFYRIAIFLVLLLPIGGTGMPVPDQPILSHPLLGPLVYHLPDGRDRAGFVPFLPVLLMVLREVVAGALRSMCATKGLVLAARTSGKVKAWFQGFTLAGCFALSGLTFQLQAWHLWWGMVMTWLCALISVGSMIEYLWVNRGTLSRLGGRSG